ncbi:adenylosuccinate synthase [Anaerolineales bacterium HSG25]|nr:adenylosuccinate synthase [Anaerolineales bacterium HSG25]
MSVTAIVGAQWGDEGKGRIVDYLAQNSQVVIRFQGGDNAGHTIVNEQTQQAKGQKIALHHIPSGIFNPETKCIIGTGCVVNPDSLLEEMATLHEIGISTDNLWLSERAQMIMPYHKLLDGLTESTKQSLGTTKKGVGPAYADKMARRGLRLGDLKHDAWLKERLEGALGYANRELSFFGNEPLELETLYQQCVAWREKLGGQIVDILPLVQQASEAEQAILLEGQLGVMRDIDWGIYPYATSSNPVPGYAAVGAGLPVTSIKQVVAVVKAYSTLVGSGPFVTELTDEAGKHLRDVGHEFGATTGRPRRCGWFDGVALAYSSWLNGFTDLAVTKLDVLDGLTEIKLCTGYRLADGTVINQFPDMLDLAPDMTHPDKPSTLEGVYETFPGWEDTKSARSWDQLPAAAQNYLKRIEELAQVAGVVKPRLTYISVGPERNQMFEV